MLQRGMKISMPHSLDDSVESDLIGNPTKVSKTLVIHSRSPPTFGEHTDELPRSCSNWMSGS